MPGVPKPQYRLPGPPAIAYVRCGQGAPLMFLHGIGGNHSSWTAQLMRFQDDYQCFAWDARGYGESEDYPEALEFEFFADDLNRLMDHDNIERAHLAGLSMGARILLDFVARYPHRVASLILCDCFYAFDQSLSPAKQAEFIALRQRPLLEGKTLAELAPTLINSLVSPHCSAAVRDQLRVSIEALHVESYLKTLAASINYNRAAALDSIQVPVQLIFGADDRLTPASIGRDMQTKIANSRLAVIPHAGHLSNMEQAEQFNQVVADFLNDVEKNEG
jgi:3-oxoadipate enol-lactonase